MSGNPDTARLRALAAAHGVLKAEPEPRLRRRQGSALITATAADRAQAIALLARHRKAQPNYRDPTKGIKGLFKSSEKKAGELDPANWIWSGSELDEVLLSKIDRATPGLVAALLDLGANVNTIREPDKVKRASTLNLPDASHRRANTVLSRAVSLRNHDNVRLLAARRASQSTLNAGLRAALGAKDSVLVEEMLQRGADANSCGHHVSRIAAGGDEVILRLLLSSTKPVHVDHLSAALGPSAAKGMFNCVGLLLAHRANPNYEKASAFHQALSNHNLRIAISLAAFGSVRINSSLLTSDTLRLISDISERQMLYDFIELLAANSIPPNTDGLPQCLLEAARKNWLEMVQLLVTHQVSPDFNEARSLIHAVRDGRLEMANILLQGQISSRNATRALQSLPRMVPSPARTTLVRKLIRARAAKSQLGELLLLAVEQEDHDLISLLAQNKAPLGTQNSQVLRSVIAARNIEALRVLLKQTSDPGPLNMILPCIREAGKLSKSERHEATRLILRAGANGEEVDASLLAAVADQSQSRDLDLIDELLQGKADVNYRDGKCLQLAVEQSDVVVLERLLRTSSSASKLQALPLILSTGSRQREDALRMLNLLMEHDAIGDAVSRTLVHAILGGLDNLDIIAVLVAKGADVSFNNSQSLILSLDYQNDQILNIVIASRTLIQSSIELGLNHVVRKSNLNLDRAKILLEKSTRKVFHSMLLLSECRSSTCRHALVALLLQCKAEVNTQDGQALVSAVHRLDIALVKLLLTNGANKTSRDHAFRSIHLNAQSSMTTTVSILELLLHKGITPSLVNDALFTATQTALSSRDLSVVKMLIRYGASADPKGGLALQLAVKASHPELTQILVDAGNTPSIRNRAFLALLGRSSNTIGASIITTANILLDVGVDQTAKDHALVSVLNGQAKTWNEPCKTMINSLLFYGASVNTADGACFIAAARYENTTLLGMLMDHAADPKLLLTSLITFGLEKPSIIRLLKYVFKHSMAPTESFRASNDPTILFTTMRTYPHDEAVLEFFLRCGFNANVSVTFALDPIVGEEQISAFLWSLDARNEQDISIPRTLLAFGASFESQGPRSGLSTISVAARDGRAEIVDFLVRSGADVCMTDESDRTPLLYACGGLGTPGLRLTMVKQILTSSNPPPVDDGSLHEAAQNLDLDVVIALIACDHDPEFPSLHHSGYSALGALCSNAMDVSSPSARYQLREVLKILLRHGSNPRTQVRQKSTIFLALDNIDNPHTVLKALLDTPVWKSLNEPEHTYRCRETGLSYSAISYVEHELYTTAPARKEDLLALLESKRCTPRYYSLEGDQPPGAIGIPPPQRQRHDDMLTHENSLRQAIQYRRSTHALDLELAREAEQESSAAFARHAEREQLSHTVKLARVKEEAQVQRDADIQRNELLLTQEQNMAVTRRAISDGERTAERDFQRQLIEQRQTELDHRINAEKRAMLDRESVDKRMLERRMSATREMERVQRRLAAAGGAQAQIEFHDYGVD